MDFDLELCGRREDKRRRLGIFSRNASACSPGKSKRRVVVVRVLPAVNGER